MNSMLNQQQPIVTLDKVFILALNTIKQLTQISNTTGLPRPPLTNRIKLYGLYKQSTEGNITNNFEKPSAVDLSNLKKWEAWKEEEGLSKDEAKTNYITYLIDTMRTYSQTDENARNLLNNLEENWKYFNKLQNSISYSINSHNYGELTNNNSNNVPRSHSPAVSLYRIASSGFHSGIVRPASRNQSYSGNGASSRRGSFNGNIMNNYANNNNNNSNNNSTNLNSNINSNSNPISVSNTNPNMEFLKWQSEINNTLNKLSYELSNLRNHNNNNNGQLETVSTGYRSVSESTLSVNSNSYYFNEKSDENNTQNKNSHSNDDNKIKDVRWLFVKIQRLLNYLFYKLYKKVNGLLGHNVLNSLIILVAFTILKDVLRIFSKKINITKIWGNRLSYNSNVGFSQIMKSLYHYCFKTKNNPSILSIQGTV